MRFPWRVALILFLTLLAGWVVLMSAYSISAGAGYAAGLPSPGRLLAIVEAVELTPPENRPVILTALQAEGRTMRVVAEPTTATTLPVLWPAEVATLEGYVRALEGRHLAVVPGELKGVPGRMMASAFNAVEFRVGLAGGDTLVVVFESPVVVAPFGLPIGFGAGILGLLISIVALVLLHREFRPLSALAAAVDRVDPMAEVTLPPIRARSPELKALVSAFERLQGRLSTLIRARMALLGGIQHDLRTFATRLRLKIEKIEDPEERARAEADITDMIALLDNALLASRSGAGELDQALVDIAPLVATEVADRQAAGAEVDLVVAEPARSASVLGDRLALRRIVANLVENALRYGHRAHLALTVAAGEIVLVVDDEGPGIPEGQRAFLLEPFARADSSRARQTGGAGLGLAVARNLVDAHRGRLVVGDAPTGGARFTVRLPLFVLGADGSDADLERRDPSTAPRHRCVGP